MIIKVKVTPGAKEDKVVGMEDDILKVRVQANAEGGKANLSVIALLSQHFKVPKRDVIIKSGETARIKYVQIENL